MKEYTANNSRYDSMSYRRCGNSGLLLSELSLGLWHNFGHVDEFDNGKQMLQTAFDKGITHFDLANNYGPPPGSAEENFGVIMKQSFLPYRDELIISTKAGYLMSRTIWRMGLKKVFSCKSRPKLKTHEFRLR